MDLKLTIILQPDDNLEVRIAIYFVNDPDFAAALAPIPLDRINIIRGDFKKCAVACLAGHYHLADLEEAETRERTASFGSTNPSPPPAIIHMLKELGFSKLSFVTEHLELFPTIPEKADERELPVPLSYSGDSCSRQPTLFTEDAFEDIYRNHVAAIELNRRDAPKATHKLLHGLFNQVM
ncbi:hypothetical protein B0H14DRAFT_3865651 [Mycena olivaceomarginata]|nr:hypothetical protein B0H14DRAFT_3865651 [Mycena olivaceomarginata]